MATEKDVLTDINGVGSVTYTAPATGGSAVVTATVAGVATPTVFNIDVAGDVLSAVSSLTPQVAVSQTSTLTVKLVDKDGAAKANETINFAITGGGAGSLSAASASTNASGETSVVYTAAAGGAGTSVTVEASGATVSPVTFTVSVLATPKDVLSVPAGLAQSVVIGENLPITVRLIDAGSVAKSSVTINFALTGAGSLSAASAVTDASGNATVTYNSTGATVGGSVSIVISGTNFDPATITISPLAAPKDVLTVTSGLTPSVVLGENLPVTVRLVDSASAAKSGVAINFALTGAGSLSASSANTDASGNAAITYNSTGAVADTSVSIAVSGTNFDPATITISVTAAQVITVESLLQSMVDRARLARSLPYNYKVSEASSADIRQFDDDLTATFPTGNIFGASYNLAKEFANNDWCTFLEHHQNRNPATGTDTGSVTPRLISARPTQSTGASTTTQYSSKAQGDHSKDIRRYTYIDKTGPGALVWFHWQSIQNWDHQQELKILIYIDGEAVKERATPGTGVAAIEGPLIDFMGGEKFVPNPLSQHSGGPLIDLSSVTGEWSIADTTRYDALYDANDFGNEEGVPFSIMEKRIQCKSHNVYFPITYNEGVLVQLEGTMNIPGHLATSTTDMQDDRMWWCLQDAAFDAGTNVESYSAAVRTANEQRIKDTAIAIDSRTATGVASTATDNTTLLGAIAPDGEKVLNLTGPLSITKLTFKISAIDLSQALRSTILEITFDGGVAGAPQVLSPIGDFFGTGYQISPSHTWNLQTEFDGTMHCVFVMPFKTSAAVKIRNIGAQSITVDTASVSTNPWTWDDATDKHFYAQWKIYNRLLNDPEQFLNIVRITGNGLFVGLYKSIYNAPPGYQQTTGWWGEGEKRITVDGEAKAAIVSSGTEESDRYNLSRLNWYSEPQGALARGDGNDYDPGLSITITFDILAPAKFDFELLYEQEWWSWDKKKAYEANRGGTPNPRVATAPGAGDPEGRASYAFVPYWYASPGSTHTITFDETAAKSAVVQTREQLYADPTPALATPALLPQTINWRPFYLLAKDWEVASNTGPDVGSLRESQLSGSGALSAGDLEGRSVAFWQNTSATGVLTYRFHTWVAGDYDIKVKALKANDSGNFDIAINGGTAVSATLVNTPATDPAITPPETIDLGTQTLNSGVNTISFTCTGGGNAGGDRFLILDGVDLTPSTGVERFTFLDLAGTYPVGYTGLTALNERQLSDAKLGPTGTGTEDVVAFWGNSTPDGAQLSYTLNVAKAGNYQVNLRAIKADDAGSFEISIAGTVHASVNPVDFFVPTNDPGASPQTIDLGVYALAAGDNGIIFTSRGQNSNSAGYVLILDYLEVTATTAPVGPPASTTPTVETTLPAVPAAQRTAVETAIATAATGQAFSEEDLITLLSESYWFHGIGVVADGQPIASVSSWGLTRTATVAGSITQNAAGMMFDGTTGYLDFTTPVLPATADWQVHSVINPTSTATFQNVFCQSLQVGGATGEGRIFANFEQGFDRADLFIGSDGTNVNPQHTISPVISGLSVYTIKKNGDDYSVGLDGSFTTDTKAGQVVLQVGAIMGALNRNATNYKGTLEGFFSGIKAGIIIHPNKGDDTTDLALRRFMNAFYSI